MVILTVNKGLSYNHTDCLGTMNNLLRCHHTFLNKKTAFWCSQVCTEIVILRGEMMA